MNKECIFPHAVLILSINLTFDICCSLLLKKKKGLLIYSSSIMSKSRFFKYSLPLWFCFSFIWKSFYVICLLFPKIFFFLRIFYFFSLVTYLTLHRNNSAYHVTLFFWCTIFFETLLIAFFLGRSFIFNDFKYIYLAYYGFSRLPTL